MPNMEATRSDVPSTNSTMDRQPIDQLGLLSTTRPSLALNNKFSWACSLQQDPIEIKAGVAAATSSTNNKTVAGPAKIKAGVASATSSTTSKTVAGPVLSKAGVAAATSSAAGCSAHNHVHAPQTHHIGKLEGELSQPDTSGKPYTQ
jgi:hypothetical protein